MDPADTEKLKKALAETEKFKQAVTSQGVLVGQHGVALQEIMSTLQNLTAGMIQLNEVASQLSSLQHPAQALQAPVKLWIQLCSPHSRRPYPVSHSYPHPAGTQER